MSSVSLPDTSVCLSDHKYDIVIVKAARLNRNCLSSSSICKFQSITYRPNQRKKIRNFECANGNSQVDRRNKVEMSIVCRVQRSTAHAGVWQFLYKQSPFVGWKFGYIKIVKQHYILLILLLYCVNGGEIFFRVMISFFSNASPIADESLDSK